MVAMKEKTFVPPSLVHGSSIGMGDELPGPFLYLQHFPDLLLELRVALAPCAAHAEPLLPARVAGKARLRSCDAA